MIHITRLQNLKILSIAQVELPEPYNSTFAEIHTNTKIAVNDPIWKFLCRLYTSGQLQSWTRLFRLHNLRQIESDELD